MRTGTHAGKFAFLIPRISRAYALCLGVGRIGSFIAVQGQTLCWSHARFTPAVFV
jgi:hypothetical protein